MTRSQSRAKANNTGSARWFHNRINLHSREHVDGTIGIGNDTGLGRRTNNVGLPSARKSTWRTHNQLLNDCHFHPVCSSVIDRLEATNIQCVTEPVPLSRCYSSHV